MFLVGCNDSDSKKEDTEVKEETTPIDKKMETETTTPQANLEQDFTNYIEEIVVLAPEEDRIIGLYASVTGLNYTSDEVLYYTLVDEVIPGYRQFTVELEAIMPKNPRIREMHEVYIEAANLQYNAFTLMVSAIETQDMEKMTEANKGLDEARALLRDWLYEVDAISAETGVSLE